MRPHVFMPRYCVLFRLVGSIDALDCMMALDIRMCRNDVDRCAVNKGGGRDAGVRHVEHMPSGAHARAAHVHLRFGTKAPMPSISKRQQLSYDHERSIHSQFHFD